MLREMTQTQELEDGNSLFSRVAILETELAEHVIDSSADLGRLEAGLVTAASELQQLRSFTADQLSHLEQNDQKLEQNLEQNLENMENISKDISKAMKAMKAMKDMEDVKMKMCNMTQSVDELSEKMAAMEIDLNEQTITASAVNGHLESGVATAKQDRDSRPVDVCCIHWISLEFLLPSLTTFSRVVYFVAVGWV